MPAYVLRRRRERITIRWDERAVLVTAGGRVERVEHPSEAEAQAYANRMVARYAEQGFELADLDDVVPAEEEPREPPPGSRAWFDDRWAAAFGDWGLAKDGTATLEIRPEPGDRVPDELAPLLADPRLDQPLALDLRAWAETEETWCDYRPFLAALFARRPALRKLHIDSMSSMDSQREARVGDLGPLWDACPDLRELSVSGLVDSLGSIEAPALERFYFYPSTLTRALAASIAGARWPALVGLDVALGGLQADGERVVAPPGTAVPADLQPLFDRPPPLLHALRLSDVLDVGDLIARLAGSPLVAQLRQLELDWCWVTPADAAALVAASARFRHLEMLRMRLGRSASLDRAARARVAAALPNADLQAAPDA